MMRNETERDGGGGMRDKVLLTGNALGNFANSEVPMSPLVRATIREHAADLVRACDVPAEPVHDKDSDCTLDDTGGGTCIFCSVLHGEPCLECGGRGFHKSGCPEYGGPLNEDGECAQAAEYERGPVGHV